MHRNLPQNKEALLKSYTTRLKEDVKSMLENFEGYYFITKYKKGINLLFVLYFIFLNAHFRNNKISKGWKRISVK